MKTPQPVRKDRPDNGLPVSEGFEIPIKSYSLADIYAMRDSGGTLLEENVNGRKNLIL